MPTGSGRAGRTVTPLVVLLAALAVASSLAGLILRGGPGRHLATTTRGTTTVLYGEGLYRADTWLIGAGNRGQDMLILVVEVPLLLVTLLWWRRGGNFAAPVLVGVLAFFTYYYVSMTFGTAQNRLFPVYVAAASLAGFALVGVASRLDVAAVARRLPGVPGRRALVAYLVAVAGALTLAWLPRVIGTAINGDIAAAVGPYTSSVTDALDLGLVAPLAVIAAIHLLRGRPAGKVLALVILVVNVSIGLLLMGQGVAQLLSGVPLTVGEIVARMLTFAFLTLVAGALLARLAGAARQAGPTRTVG